MTLQNATNNQSNVASLEVTESRNLAFSDCGRHLFYQGSTAITLTVPANVFAQNNVIEIAQLGTGVVSVISGGSGLTINGVTTSISIPGQWRAIVLKFYSGVSCAAFGV